MNQIFFSAPTREHFQTDSVVETEDRQALTNYFKDGLVKEAFKATANVHHSAVEHKPRLYKVLNLATNELALFSEIEWKALAANINSLILLYNMNESSVLIINTPNNIPYHPEVFPDTYDDTILELYRSNIIHTEQFVILILRKYSLGSNFDNFKNVLPFLKKLDPETLITLLSIKDKKGKTPLHYKKKFKRAIPLLKKLDSQSLVSLICVQDEQGKTPLHYISLFKIAIPFLMERESKDLLAILSITDLKNVPLFYRIEIAFRLVKKLDSQDLMTLLSTKDDLGEGRFPLHYNDIFKKILPLLVKLEISDLYALLSLKNNQGKGPLNDNQIFGSALPLILPLSSPEMISNFALNIDPAVLYKDIKENVPDYGRTSPINILNDFALEFGPLGKLEDECDEEFELRKSEQINSAGVYVTNIPHEALAAACGIKCYAVTLTYFYEAFSPKQQKVILACLSPSDATIIMSKGWNKNEDSSAVKNATQQQKIALLNNGHLKFHYCALKNLSIYKIDFESKMEHVRSLIGKIEAQSVYQNLKKEFKSFDNQNHMTIEKYLLPKVSSLQKRLLGRNPSEYLKSTMAEMNAFFQKVLDAVTTLKTMRSAIQELDSQIQLEEQVTIPEIFYCPILYSVMKDPVKAEDEYVYERNAIEKIIDDSGLSPITRRPLSKSKLMPQHALRADIEEFRKAYPELVF